MIPTKSPKQLASLVTTLYPKENTFHYAFKKFHYAFVYIFYQHQLLALTKKEAQT